MRIAVFILIALLANPANAQLIWFGKKMSVDKAEARWGNERFDVRKFKEGDLAIRARMAASLVRNKNVWIGKDISEVRAKLGAHDGFYFNDTIPAYFISTETKTDGESWQVVFLPDVEYKVKEVIIELNGSR